MLISKYFISVCNIKEQICVLHVFLVFPWCPLAPVSHLIRRTFHFLNSPSKCSQNCVCRAGVQGNFIRVWKREKKRKEKLFRGRIFNTEFLQLVNLLLSSIKTFCLFRTSLGAVSHSVLAVLWSAAFDSLDAFWGESTGKKSFLKEQDLMQHPNFQAYFQMRLLNFLTMYSWVFW